MAMLGGLDHGPQGRVDGDDRLIIVRRGRVRGPRAPLMSMTDALRLSRRSP
jgi:hypothetical protein